ncbi:hypothetical protein PIB30_013115 [Stylosanthes scabra]|uniref:Uncharacterized protein n=1 Tax=Stylosanthes scabra TaxID=79078 RepID=A0ABU6V7Z8_9FABA|nr:hypothetical protein [Stylosanthes scabra]
MHPDAQPLGENLILPRIQIDYIIIIIVSCSGTIIVFFSSICSWFVLAVFSPSSLPNSSDVLANSSCRARQTPAAVVLCVLTEILVPKICDVAQNAKGLEAAVNDLALITGHRPIIKTLVLGKSTTWNSCDNLLKERSMISLFLDYDANASLVDVDS